MGNNKLSVIIITLNEEEFIENLLIELSKADDIEIIVSDGGSIDRTARVARKYTDKVILGERGRGIQLNAGARLATGNILWFLHADSKLPLNYKYHISQTMEIPESSVARSLLKSTLRVPHWKSFPGLPG